jgi:hypothetical protein
MAETVRSCRGLISHCTRSKLCLQRLFLVLLPCWTWAEDPSRGVDEATQRRRVEALRVEEGPKVDGVLDDSVWARATLGGELVQVLPVPGAKPSERTEFRVVYDDHALYVGVECFHRDTDAILAREMARDGLAGDDTITVVLDSFHDFRNGFQFQVNPNGARGDGLITDNTGTNTNWDGIWEAKASLHERGWQAEMAIPFKTLSFDPQIDTWGFNIEREIQRSFETARWSGARPEVAVANVVDAGELTGLRGLRQGIGLDVIPYALSRYRNDRVARREFTRFDGGVDARYRVTPNLTAQMSYNTDFADAEADTRQINLTRFPLFFPEKRAFFLEDSGIFQFGGAGSSLLPFFSRRIGLASSGQVAPILVASKVTGRAGKYSVGLIDAVLDDQRGLGVQNALVGRVKRNVLKQSSVGLITTIGDPNSRDDNALGGVDYNYRTTEFLGDQTLEASVFGLGTNTESLGDDVELAWGGSLAIPEDSYAISLSTFEIATDFNPALGFAPRRGVRNYQSSWSYRPRPQSIPLVRQLFYIYSNSHWTSLSNDLESVDHTLFHQVKFESADEVLVSVRRIFDGPEQDFEISKGVVIPADDYWWYEYEVHFDTAPRRLFRFGSTVVFGEFYQGERELYSVNTTFLPSKYVGLQASHGLNAVRLPEGSFDTQLSSLRLQINFKPDMTWATFLQYDNVSDTYGYNSRFRWELKPGTDLLLVFNQLLNDASRVLLTEAVTKLQLTVRF